MKPSNFSTEYFKLALKLNKEYEEILLKNEMHYRGSLNSFSLISLSKERPELGIKCNFKSYTQTNDLKSLILADIEEINSKENGRVTPEKELQSWIIKYALKNNGRLPFNEYIYFITSELAILNKDGKKIVNDILGYNKKTNQLCIIELKSDRLLSRLIKQVDSFEQIILDNDLFFKELLLINGISSKNSMKIKKVVVWSHSTNSPKKELKDAGIAEFTYKPYFTFNDYSSF